MIKSATNLAKRSLECLAPPTTTEPGCGGAHSGREGLSAIDFLASQMVRSSLVVHERF